MLGHRVFERILSRGVIGQGQWTAEGGLNSLYGPIGATALDSLDMNDESGPLLSIESANSGNGAGSIDSEAGDEIREELRFFLRSAM